MNSGFGESFFWILNRKNISEIFSNGDHLQHKIMDNFRHGSNMDIFRIKNAGNEFLIYLESCGIEEHNSPEECPQFRPRMERRHLYRREASCQFPQRYCP